MLRLSLSGVAELFLLFVLAASAFGAKSASSTGARKSLDAFNAKWIASCQKMDNAAAAALWADDGVDLLPGMQPMVGKTAIATWLNGLTPQLQGAKMLYCTVDWREIKMQGDWAYEWGINRQKIAFPPPQKPFANEGKVLLIVKRQPAGDWKLELESWNSNPQPDEKP